MRILTTPTLLALLCSAATAQPATVVINEFLAKNVTGLTDEAGEADDWIELANVSTAPVAVGGMYLTDRPTNLTKWQFPQGFTIQPGAKLIVWADEDGAQGPLHTNFKLAAAGEDLLLVDTDGTTILDQIQYGPQLDDTSTARIYDGSLHWVTFPVPTPAQTNAIEPCGSRNYSGLDPTRQSSTMAITGTPGVGRTIGVEVRGSQPSRPHAMLFGFAPDEQDLPVPNSSKLLLAAPIAVLPTITSDGAGTAVLQIPIPNDAGLVGASAFFQAFTNAQGTLAGSNGIEIKICP